MMLLFQDGAMGAKFSRDRKYRYALWRWWDLEKPLVMIIGLNPSTANEIKNDATINKVTKLAKHWGFGGFYMMNLFAFVTAYPEELQKCMDPIGENDMWLKEISKACKKIVFAWGNFKEAAERGKLMREWFPEASALKINKNGSPKHPLYCSDTTELIPYLKP